LEKISISKQDNISFLKNEIRILFNKKLNVRYSVKLRLKSIWFNFEIQKDRSLNS